MDSENEKIILRVEVDSSEAERRQVEVAKNLIRLREKQRKLTAEYKSSQVEVGKYNVA